ncbi:MAG TPA: Spy/CpxP family protein refolding chaperone [Candidatus Omnitrophota bacterium]|nr:Spy/CpxP family protein refolding chaperone [Candidatus Omnitrophota bacterium]HPD84383.1 Spy/CpxP family protein refolding chaperone [Candidatus Omnitrophota bacterium]HRZ03241.1 Spy/CpxP family protein refolding chaperone [Candidatus Omnitrophota bacterium]
MDKLKTVLVGLAVIFLIGGVAYAQPEGEGLVSDDGSGPEASMPRHDQNLQKGDRRGSKGGILKELNLTPEQQEKLEANRKAQREETAKLFAAMKEKQAKLKEELTNPAVTKEAVAPIVSEIKSLQEQLTDRRVDGILAVKEILTPEQFEKFQQLTEKRPEKGKGRFGNRREKRENKKGME